MPRNLLVAGVLTLACLPTPAKAEAFYTHPHVKQVLCDEGKGSAWRISRGRFASVNHVTSLTGCKINGKPLTVEYADPFGDFSIVTVEDDQQGGIPVNCAGFFHGFPYYSVGFARGWPVSVVITLRADNLHPNPNSFWQLFTGIEHVIPGQSGGPILNQAGEAVGSINAFNPFFGVSWSRSLKETPLCANSSAAR